MKKIVLFAFVLVLIGAFAWKTDPKDPLYEIREVAIGGETFKAYVSDTEELRKNGLSGFAGLEKSEAMLFIFEKPDTHSFWMKDMLFAIDILWLDDEFRVVHIEKNVSPESYPKTFYPKSPSLYAVEFAAGTLEGLRVREGDSATISGGK